MEAKGNKKIGAPVQGAKVPVKAEVKNTKVPSVNEQQNGKKGGK